MVGKWTKCAQVVKEIGGDASSNLTALREGTIIITGSNAGIGRRTAQELVGIGAHVVLAVRNLNKGEAAVQKILKKVGNEAGKARCMQLDLASLKSVEAFVQSFQTQSTEEGWAPLKCLILNAGMLAFDGKPTNTENGVEQVFQVNHLGHFHLTQLLLPSLRSAAPSRVIALSSSSHTTKLTFDFGSKEDLMTHVVHPSPKVYDTFKNYGYSKLCNILFAQSLHSKEAQNGVVACSLHPGDMIGTDIAKEHKLYNFVMKWILPLINKSVDQGSSTTILCSLLNHEKLKGAYFEDCKETEPRPSVRGENGQKARDVLWELSEELIQQAKL